MPIIDTRLIDRSKIKAKCDVCIVGAGAAGIYLGTRLAQLGLDVVILEAGGRNCKEGELLGIEAGFEGAFYSSATKGRAFGLGGSTSQWGGLLVPHSKLDIRPGQDRVFDPWQHIIGVVEKHSCDVFNRFGLNSHCDRQTIVKHLLGDTADVLHSCNIEIVMADFLKFRQKNLSGLLYKELKRKRNLTVYLHAVATNWQVFSVPDGLSSIRSIKARSGEKTVIVNACSFVLATGAIESVRILLEIERQIGSSPFRRGAAVGRYLGDHLSCNIGDVKPEDWPLTVKLFSPIFINGHMRSFRFLERSPLGRSPRGFAHFIFENKNAGFLLAKKILIGMQSKVLPKFSVSELIHGSTGLLALGWNRAVHSRLYYPPNTPVHLQLDIEQQPNYKNCIFLGNQLDAFDRPIPMIQWDIRKEDYEAIRILADRILSLWPGQQRGFPDLLTVRNGATSHKPHDAYHPVGVCRLGIDKESVVGPDLKVHGISNLAVLSTAVFPSAGTANPTFSMLCLGEALAQRLSREKKD